jgi:hypothetical protein
MILPPPPAIGIFVGDGVLGEEINFPLVFKGDMDNGEFSRVALAIKLFKSLNELLRFFFADFDSLSSGGGEAPIVLSLFIGPLELEGRSSKAPRTVGLSRDIGRRLGDSMECERWGVPPAREILGGLECSFGIGVRLDLLSVLNTEPPLLVLFERKIWSANLFLKDEVCDVTEPVAEGLDRLPEIEP